MKNRDIRGQDGRYTQHYRHMCFNKWYFRNEFEATVWAAERTKRKPIYRAYKCDYCSGWHLTTKNPNIRFRKMRDLRNRLRCPTTGKRVFLLEREAKSLASQVGGSHSFCKGCNAWHCYA